jgi:hypothetical protein
MKKYLRKIIDQILAPYLSRETKFNAAQIPSLNQATQILLRLKYQELARAKAPLPKFEDVEFRCFSQNGEDGILLYIFSLIDTTNKKLVEIGCGNGLENNSANLIVNHGWHGLLFDGNQKNISSAKDFYNHSKDTFVNPPQTIKAWVTKENINQLITENNFKDQIDLLSLDIDGMDYWIWQALEVIEPRVVVLEYHEEFGTESVTVPYNQGFQKESENPRYFGASLPAFVKLAKEKGYRLVGCNHQKFNAFFIKDNAGQSVLPEVKFETCLRKQKATDYTLLQKLSQYPFQKI